MRAVCAAVIGGVCFAIGAPAPAQAADDAVARVRRIILDSRQLGAHGMGYGERSLNELSRRLKPADIPVLVSLVRDRELRVGAQFALASQCEAAIAPVQEAAIQHKIDFLDATDTMELISGHAACTQGAKDRARQARTDLDAEQAKAMQKAKRDAEEDARIQRNAVQMTQGGAQARSLSREEREEVYRRSLKAMGLTEDGPMTPQQREMVQRMYKAMVLDEPGPASPNTPPK